MRVCGHHVPRRPVYPDRHGGVCRLPRRLVVRAACPPPPERVPRPLTAHAAHSCAGDAAPPEGCPAGTYVEATGSQSNAACGACAAGYVSTTAGQAACEACPAGFECAAASAQPVACTAGSYSAPAASACTPCPAGFYCPLSSAVPRACPQGSYALAGAAACDPCPAGSQCAAADEAPTACAAAEVSGAEAIACTPCPAGFECPDTVAANQVRLGASFRIATRWTHQPAPLPGGLRCGHVLAERRGHVHGLPSRSLLLARSSRSVPRWLVCRCHRRGRT